MNPRVLLLVVACAVLSRDQLAAQCCTAGNPVNTNSPLTDHGKNILNVSGAYMYSFSDEYFSGTKRLEKTYAVSNYDYSSLALSYGLSGALKLTADVGYYFDKSQRFVSSNYTRYAQGISDGTLGIQYSTYESGDKLFEILQTAKTAVVKESDPEIEYAPGVELGLGLTKELKLDPQAAARLRADLGWATAGALAPFTSNDGRTAFARSMKSRTASYCVSVSSGGIRWGSGAANEGTR